MKSYLVVFFMLLSFVGFGQHGCYLQFCTPEKGLHYFYQPDYYFNNHFQELFPAEKMKLLNIKSAMIHSEYKADIPSIHINRKPIVEFNLDKNGFVTYYKSSGEQVFYTRKNEKILTKKQFASFHEGDTITFYYLYDSTKMIINGNPTRNLTLGANEYVYDNKKRIISHISHGFSSKIDTTYYNYDEVNRNIIKIYNEPKTTLTNIIMFNQKWQPIKEQIIADSIILFESNYIYEENSLVDYNLFIFQPKKIQNENGDWVSVNSDDLSTYTKEEHKTTFHYNNKGLLEKIIQTTDQGVCEYRVYYYTE